MLLTGIIAIIGNYWNITQYTIWQVTRWLLTVNFFPPFVSICGTAAPEFLSSLKPVILHPVNIRAGQDVSWRLAWRAWLKNRYLPSAECKHLGCEHVNTDPILFLSSKTLDTHVHDWSWSVAQRSEFRSSSPVFQCQWQCFSHTMDSNCTLLKFWSWQWHDNASGLPLGVFRGIGLSRDNVLWLLKHSNLPSS